MQENLMKNSERLIAFLSMTLQRCASLCQHRLVKKAHDEESDFEAGVTERQSLQTALALITQIVTSPSVQVEQWEMLGNCLGDLTILSELHESTEIKTLSKKLKNLIEVNVQVLQHQSEVKEKANDIIKKTEEAQNKMKELKILAEKQHMEKKETFDEALEHLKDNEVPIKGMD